MKHNQVKSRSTGGSNNEFLTPFWAICIQSDMLENYRIWKIASSAIASEQSQILYVLCHIEFNRESQKIQCKWWNKGIHNADFPTNINVTSKPALTRLQTHNTCHSLSCRLTKLWFASGKQTRFHRVWSPAGLPAASHSLRQICPVLNACLFS